MDQGTFNQYRERIGASITTRLNDAYSQGIISGEESPIIARFILDNIDKANDHNELLAFLEELAQKWPIFGPILVMERSQEQEDQNTQTIAQAEQLIKDNRIDEALAVVENTNNNEQKTEGGQN